jgi:dihydrofolate synthase/folylpolyglutamate synthase
LRATGLKVGRYTSPHLIDFRERITVNSVPIPEEAVLAFLEQWIPVAEETGATFFELTTALAFDWFAKQKVDVAVIETGLGGRLDSTNVLTPRVATVTSIGLDHTDLLGDTLELIAREKAGIFKRAVPAIIGEASPKIRALLAENARDAGADPVIVIDDKYRISEIQVSARGTSFSLESGTERTRLTTPLIGEFQARNTAIAIATVAALGVKYTPSREETSKALAKIALPGRFQRWRSFIFDVAHNPDGARTVAESIRALNPPAPRTALVAVLADKDWKAIIRALAPAIDRFVFTNAPSAPPERRWDPSQAQAFAKSHSFESQLEPDLDTALERAQKSSETVLVTGSFHTVGDVMSRLQVSPFAA